jgi:hypothetical protein
MLAQCDEDAATREGIVKRVRTIKQKPRFCRFLIKKERLES